MIKLINVGLSKLAGLILFTGISLYTTRDLRRKRTQLPNEMSAVNKSLEGQT